MKTRIKVFVGVVSALMILGVIIGVWGSEKTPIEETLNIPQLRQPAVGDEIAVISTTMGDIEILLLPEVAPLAVENFKKLNDEGYYDGLVIDLIRKNKYVRVQSNPLYPTGKGELDEVFPIESNDNYGHISGAVNMGNYVNHEIDKKYRKNDFFAIVCNDEFMPSEKKFLYSEGNSYSNEMRNAYDVLGGMPSLDGQFTVFAQVCTGMEIVRKIMEIPSEEESGTPSEYVIINAITIKSIK